MITILLHLITTLFYTVVACFVTGVVVAAITEAFRLVDDLRDFILWAFLSLVSFAFMCECWKVFGLVLKFYFF